MIRITAVLKLKEGTKEAFIAMAKDLIDQSQAEAGCIDYNLYQSKDDENTVTFIEAWKDQEAIELHNNSAHFTSIVPKFGDYVVDQAVTLYDLIY